MITLYVNLWTADFLLLQSRPPPPFSTGDVSGEGHWRRSVEVRVCVWFSLCYEGSDSGTHRGSRNSFRAYSRSPSWPRKQRRPKEVFPGLGDAEAAEGAFQLFVVNRRYGQGSVAFCGGGAVLLTRLPSAPPSALGAAPRRTVMCRGRRRGQAEEAGRELATHRGRRVHHAAVPGRLAEGVLQLVLPGSRGTALAGRRRTHRSGHRPTQQRVFLFQGAIGVRDVQSRARLRLLFVLHLLFSVLLQLALVRAVVGRGRIWLFGVEVGLGFWMGDAHALHVDVDQEIKFPVHTKNLQNDRNRRLDDENLFILLLVLEILVPAFPPWPGVPSCSGHRRHLRQF